MPSVRSLRVIRPRLVEFYLGQLFTQPEPHLQALFYFYNYIKVLFVIFKRIRLCRTGGARRIFQARGREPVEHEGPGIAAAVLVQGALAAVEQGEDAARGKGPAAARCP